MSAPNLPAGAPELVAAIEAALAARPEERILRLSHEGQSLVVKRASDQTRAPWVTWIAARIAGSLSPQPLPRQSLALSDQGGLIRIEARRLRSLCAAGVRVPQILAEGQDWLALEAVGMTLERALRRCSRVDGDALLERTAIDLAAFHRAGHWHGGSQVKNLMLWQGEIYRIDFEEDIGEHLPLAVAQTLDLVLLVNSCLLLDDRGEAAWQAMGETLLERYFAAHPAADIRRCLQRAMLWLRAITFLARPWRHKRGRSLRRVFLLRRCLERVLA
ncbi:MAG: hypothetical protein ACOZCK_16325 [Pseudomonadota bacterium]|jgi:tRNA A-37 threonylcarbamoyl transferase component Bud32